MKKAILIISVLLFTFNNYAQKNRMISYTFQDQDGFKCNSTLYIFKNESIYRIEDNREEGVEFNENENNNYIKVVNDKISKIFYSTKKDAKTRIPLYKDEVIYNQQISDLKYEFTGKSKKIGKYNCQEAKLNLNGRKYTIWFTPDIGTNFGPYKINGLPGLVVELSEEISKIKITLQGIKNLKDNVEFEKYKKYIESKKSLTSQEYDKSITELLVNKRISANALAKELEITIEYADDETASTQFIIDIPKNLASELKKVK